MEKRRYYVMRKDEIITLASFDNEGKMLDYAEPSSPRQIAIAPLAYRTLGHDWLKKWWKERSIPLTRDQIQSFLKENGYSAPSEYLIKNLGLSLTDYYWVRPVNSDLCWDDINLFKNDFHDDIFMPDLENNETDTPRYSPNSSLQGNIEKAWTIINGKRSLVKGNHSRLSSESINEVIASKIHTLQNYSNHTDYKLIKIAGKAYDYGCVSEAFTTENTELVSAWEICTSEKKDNNTSYYEHFINIAGKHGIDTQLLRQDLEYQILTDFLISGYDRHLTNVAVLRDADSLQFLRMAPIYDSGGSMFVDRPFPESLKGLERMPVTSFCKSESKLLDLVRDPGLIDLSKLPSPSWIRHMYEKDTQISEKTVNQVIQWYEKKTEMLRELQLGIHPFHRKSVPVNYVDDEKTPEIFLLIAKSPENNQTEQAGHAEQTERTERTERTKQAEKIYKDLKTKDWHEVPISALYSVNDAAKHIFPYFDQEEMIDEASNKKYPLTRHDSFTYVSPDNIRELLTENNIYASNEIVSGIADAQIHCALSNGISVICETTNPDAAIREHYLSIARKYKVNEIELFE